jgi:hypothetical protein
LESISGAKRQEILQGKECQKRSDEPEQNGISQGAKNLERVVHNTCTRNID